MADDRKLLRVFDSLEDLRLLAEKQKETDETTGTRLEKLRNEFCAQKRSFVCSEITRNRDSCPLCSVQFKQLYHLYRNGEEVQDCTLSELEVHQVRTHRKDWPNTAVRSFLNHVASKSSSDSSSNSKRSTEDSSSRGSRSGLDDHRSSNNSNDHDARENADDDEEDGRSKRRRFDAERVPTERPASVVVVGDSGSAGKNVNRVVVDRDNECPFLVKIYIKEHQDWREEDFRVSNTTKLPTPQAHVHAWKDTTLREIVDLLKESAVPLLRIDYALTAPPPPALPSSGGGTSAVNGKDREKDKDTEKSDRDRDRARDRNVGQDRDRDRDDRNRNDRENRENARDGDKDRDRERKDGDKRDNDENSKHTSSSNNNSTSSSSAAPSGPIIWSGMKVKFSSVFTDKMGKYFLRELGLVDAHPSRFSSVSGDSSGDYHQYGRSSSYHRGGRNALSDANVAERTLSELRYQVGDGLALSIYYKRRFRASPNPSSSTVDQQTLETEEHGDQEDVHPDDEQETLESNNNNGDGAQEEGKEEQETSKNEEMEQ